MPKPRRQWAVQPPLMRIARTQHRSKPAAYRQVHEWAKEFRAGTLNPAITQIEVYVDEQNGDGWQLHERVELADYGTWLRPR